MGFSKWTVCCGGVEMRRVKICLKIKTKIFFRRGKRYMAIDK